MSFETTMDHLRVALSAAVPLCILELEARGCLMEDDMRACKDISQFLGGKADLLMFRVNRCGEAAEVFSQLARGLAILSFAPGGVTFLGEHWESGDTNRRGA